MPVTVSAPSEPVSPLLTSGEQLYSPAAAKASNIPGHRGGTRLNGATVWRFIHKGKIVNGELIRLEAVRVGDRWLTSVEALNRFFTKLTAATLPASGTGRTPTAPTPKQRQRASDRASRQADMLFGASSAATQPRK